MSHAERHPCAVCPKPIGTGFLMCWEHWKLVPRDQQQQVYRTWGRYQNVGGVGIAGFARVRNEYFAARDAAIASAQAALGIKPTTGES